MDIAEASGLGRKTIYNYFENKDIIAEYIFQNKMDTMFNLIVSDIRFEDHLSNHEKIKKLFKIFLDKLFELKEEIIYTVHYDYYFHKKANPTFMLKLIEKADLKVLLFDIFSNDDGSIDMKGKDPINQLSMMGQALMAFVSRMFFRGHIINEESGVSEANLYDFIDILTDGIKNKD